MKMNTEIITLESDDEIQNQNAYMYGNTAGTATAAIMNEKPLNNLLLSIGVPTVPLNVQNKLGNGYPTDTFLNSLHCTRTTSPNVSSDRCYNSSTNDLHVNGANGVLQKPIQLPNKCFDGSTPTTSTFSENNGHRSGVGPAVPQNSISDHYDSIRRRLNSAGPINSSLPLQLRIKRARETYLEANAGAHPNTSDDDFAGQFRCTYNGCGKRLRNNVVFMLHLWAHVVRNKPYSEAPVTNLEITKEITQQQQPLSELAKNDVSRLMTCPECLLVQPTPHRMHLHYHRVHKLNKALQATELVVCKICESVYNATSFVEHCNRHGENEMPYHCRKCRYRVSSRDALFNHFVETHKGSTMLLCPFCLISYNVSPSDRQRNVVVAKSYVEHVTDHDVEIQQGCGQCVTRFVKNSTTSLASRVEAHLRQHKDINDRWRVSRKSFSDLHPLQSKLVCSSGVPAYCLECLEALPTNLQQTKHFGEMRACTRQNCDFETNCTHAMELHSILNLCDPDNAVRWPFGVSSARPVYCDDGTTGQNLIEAEKILLECSGCGLKSADGDAICKHIVAASNEEPNFAQGMEDENEVLKCDIPAAEVPPTTTTTCHNAGVILKQIDWPDPNSGVDDKEDVELDLKSIEHFGLNRMQDINPLEDFVQPDSPPCAEYKNADGLGDHKDDEEGIASDCCVVIVETTETLSNMLPLSKVSKIQDDAVMVKYLSEKCSARVEDAEKFSLNIENMNVKLEVPSYPSSFQIPWRK